MHRLQVLPLVHLIQNFLLKFVLNAYFFGYFQSSVSSLKMTKFTCDENFMKREILANGWMILHNTLTN